MSETELRHRFGALTAEQVAALDRAAVKLGVSVMQLMEIAGWQVARCAWHLLGQRPAPVHVLAGHGNNGGDALVAARHLATWGCTVSVQVLAARDALAELVAGHARAAEACGCSVRYGESAGHDDLATAPALVLDGLLGTGLRSAPREPVASAIRLLDDSRSPVLAIDVPSGMDAGTGEAFDPCVRASATCTLAAVKAGLWEQRSAAAAGELWAADIGMPAAAWAACGLEQPEALRGGALVPVPSPTRS